MTTTISLQERTKEELDEVLAAESHTSQDSAIKALLLYRELYLQTQNGTKTQTRTSNKATSERKPSPHQSTDGHKVYSGKIGSGKTFTSKYHIHYQVEDDTGNEVIIVDPLGSYEEFTRRNGGVNIGVADALTDPFTFVANTTVSEDEHRFWVEEIALPYILSGISDEGTAVSDETVEVFLERFTGEMSEEDGLAKLVSTDEEEGLTEDEQQLNHRICQSILNDKKPLTENMPAGQWGDRLSSVDEAGTDLITVNFTGENGHMTGPATVLGATISAFTEAAMREDTVDLYIDEAHYLSAPDRGKQILMGLLRLGRQYGVNMHLVTQTTAELVDSSAAVSPIDRIDTAFLHRQEITEELRAELGMSKGEAAYLREAELGTGDSNYSEILVGEYRNWSPRRVEVSRDLQKIIDPQ